MSDTPVPVPTVDLDPPVDLDPAVDLDPPVDLDAIATDLADVEVALARLDAGTYWTCEVTGRDLPEDLLAERPTARRHPDT